MGGEGGGLKQRGNLFVYNAGGANVVPVLVQAIPTTSALPNNPMLRNRNNHRVQPYQLLLSRL